MNSEVNKSKVVFSLIWKLMERVGTQGIQIMVQILLARLLLPEDYGIIALITIFITIANVFIQSGFSIALIQKKNADEADFSTVLYLSLLVTSLCYAILFLSAPFIADFYREPQLISLIRVMAITMFFGAVNSVQNAVISRTMQFKRHLISSLVGIVLSGFVAIVLAYMGFGVWALIYQQLTNHFFITITLWFTVKWRPKFIFSASSLNRLFSFGWKLQLSALLDTSYNSLYGLVIGKVYGSAILGFYNQGNMFPNLVVSNINGAIGSVMLPALSANQDDKLKVKAMVRRSIMTSSFIVLPMMVGLAVCAESLVKFLLTDKWLSAVPFLQLLCLSYAFWPIHTVNLQAINALGRSDVFLKLEIIKKSLGVTILYASIPLGVYIMVAFIPIMSIIATVINAFPNRKLLNYGFKEQWLDILPSLLLSVIMGFVVYAIQFIGWNEMVTLLAQLITGVVVYVGISYFLKLECFIYLLCTMKQINRKKGLAGEES